MKRICLLVALLLLLPLQAMAIHQQSVTVPYDNDYDVYSFGRHIARDNPSFQQALNDAFQDGSLLFFISDPDSGGAYFIYDVKGNDFGLSSNTLSEKESKALKQSVLEYDLSATGFSYASTSITPVILGDGVGFRVSSHSDDEKRTTYYSFYQLGGTVNTIIVLFMGAYPSSTAQDIFEADVFGSLHFAFKPILLYSANPNLVQTPALSAVASTQPSTSTPTVKPTAKPSLSTAAPKVSIAETESAEGMTAQKLTNTLALAAFISVLLTCYIVSRLNKKGLQPKRIHSKYAVNETCPLRFHRFVQYVLLPINLLLSLLPVMSMLVPSLFPQTGAPSELWLDYILKDARSAPWFECILTPIRYALLFASYVGFFSFSLYGWICFMGVYVNNAVIGILYMIFVSLASEMSMFDLMTPTLLGNLVGTLSAAIPIIIYYTKRRPLFHEKKIAGAERQTQPTSEHKADDNRQSQTTPEKFSPKDYAQYCAVLLYVYHESLKKIIDKAHIDETVPLKLCLYDSAAYFVFLSDLILWAVTDDISLRTSCHIQTVNQIKTVFKSDASPMKGCADLVSFLEDRQGEYGVVVSNKAYVGRILRSHMDETQFKRFNSILPLKSALLFSEVLYEYIVYSPRSFVNLEDIFIKEEEPLVIQDAFAVSMESSIFEITKMANEQILEYLQKYRF